MLVDRRTLLTRGPCPARNVVPGRGPLAAASIARRWPAASRCCCRVRTSGTPPRPTTPLPRPIAWMPPGRSTATTAPSRWSTAAPPHAPARHRRRAVRAARARPRSVANAPSGAFDVTTTPLSRCWGFVARDGPRPGSGRDRRGPRHRRHAARDARRRCAHGALRRARPRDQPRRDRQGRGGRRHRRPARAARRPPRAGLRRRQQRPRRRRPRRRLRRRRHVAARRSAASPACGCGAARSAPAASAGRRSSRTAGASAT